MKMMNQSVIFFMIGVLFAAPVLFQSSFANDIQEKSQDTQGQDYPTSLNIHYVMKSTNDFAPAYMDYSNRILFVWRDVNLRIDQVPNRGPYDYNPILDLAKKKYAVQETTPPVRYLISEKGGLRVGYYDCNARIFFVWQGFEIKMPQTGIDAFEKRKLKDKEVLKRIEIPIPTNFWAALFM